MTIVCSKCKEPRDAALFRSDPKKSNGKRSQCKPCDRAYAREWQKVSRQNVRWKAENTIAWSRKQFEHMLRRYGLTVDGYYELLDKQAGRCAICGTDKPKTRKGSRQAFVIDHCHTTNVVRGLLCMNCNAGIGCLGDNPRIVDQAAAYLRHWGAAEACDASDAANEANQG